MSNPQYMRDYFLQHSSVAHKKLKAVLIEDIEEFVILDEFLLHFYSKSNGIAIILLQEDHDHADGYFIEALLKRRLEQENVQTLFIPEREVEEDLKALIERLPQSIIQ